MVNNSARRMSGESIFHYPELIYKVDSTPWNVKEIFPVAPAIREEMLPYSSITDYINENDWTPVFDISEIEFSPRSSLSNPLTIGRHGRDGAEKWLPSPEDILRTFPEGDEFKILVLGGAEHAKKVLGRDLPENWTVIPFGGMLPSEYLRKLDAFVYFPHPNLNEAFGRTVVEAIFAGVPCILPNRFRGTFGKLAIYSSTERVPTVIRHLASDNSARLAHLTWARSFAERAFGANSLTLRLPELSLQPAHLLETAVCPPEVDVYLRSFESIFE